MKKSTLLAFALMTTLSSNAQQTEVPLERKIAQMLLFGFRGEVSDSSSIVYDIRERGIGGVIIFDGNVTPTGDGDNPVKRIKEMCTTLQSSAPEKLIIAIDQEGGRVNRLKAKYGFTPSVTAEYLGKLNSEDSSRYYYGKMANQLKELGINLNFGPDTDVNINPECPIIGAKGRSYSASPAIVNKHARFFIEEHHKHGIKTSIKHFPGHGSSLADSHLGFTDVSNTWKSKELIPFKYFIQNSLCDMVMVSHTFNSKFDKEYPASLSRLTIDSLLRKKLGYDGIVITDDMNMKAITSNYSFAEAMELTINAGVDMIIINSNVTSEGESTVKQAIDTIVSLVRDGKISSQRIDEAYNRVVRFKEGLNK